MDLQTNKMTMVVSSEALALLKCRVRTSVSKEDSYWGIFTPVWRTGKYGKYWQLHHLCHHMNTGDS